MATHPFQSDDFPYDYEKLSEEKEEEKKELEEELRKKDE
jgi:hypothetical protein